MSLKNFKKFFYCSFFVFVCQKSSLTNPNPLSLSSFKLWILFLRLVVTGYRKPLTEDDMFALNPSDQSKTVVNEFESHWRQQEIKIKQKLKKYVIV
jgi:hypothetical protein